MIRAADVAAAAARAREAAARATDDAIVVVTVAAHAQRAAPLASLGVEGAAATDPGRDRARDSIVWQPPTGACFVAHGEAARLDASGDQRVARIAAASEALFARLVEVRAGACDDAPSTRLFGGIAFRAEASREAPWSAFGDASFSLPRVRLATSGGRSWLSIALALREARASSAIERAFDEAARWLDDGAADDAAAPVGVARGARLAVERASAERFGAAVRDALRRIDEGTLEKVVATAPCRVCADRPLCPARALARLGAAYPSCTRFALQRGGAVFLGASPETLASVRGGVALVDALAGTTQRRADPIADARALAALLASDKDLREHVAVVRAVVDAIAPIARAVRAAPSPRVKSLRNVHHLHTPIEARLADGVRVLDLVARLHPTPAVAGVPKDRALAWLADHEIESRGWYAGPVGWFDASGDGTFAVALRAGVIEGARAWLYAGAGIVAGSDPAAEYAETRAKHAPMLDALEVAP